MELNLLKLMKHVQDPEVFTAGQTIFTEGSPGDTMYVVLVGNVDIQVGGKTLDVAEPGTIIGEMALIDASARSATAIARDDCKLAPVNERQFLYMVEQTPFFALFVMRVLARRLRRMDVVR